MNLSRELIACFHKKANLTQEQLSALLADCGNNAFLFVQRIIQNGMMTRDAAGMALGDHLGCTYLNLQKTLFQQEVLDLLPKELAQRHRAIPVYKFGRAITVAMAEPLDGDKVQQLTCIMGGMIDTVLSLPDEIEAAIRIQYEQEDTVDSLALSFDFELLKKLLPERLVELRQIVELSNSILLLALKENVSDIHIEVKAQECRVRYRIDGVLQNKFVLPAALASPLVARYKVMAQLDISERRLPQDGRLSFATPIKAIDIRISILPTLHGEKVVMRILGSIRESVKLELGQMSISQHNLVHFKNVLDQPNGVVLVTGPTGSGKTTTLYAALDYINKPEINITTIEDPVEYEISAYNQTQVHTKIGRTFAVLLRSILRQDPDVLLIGEIRDGETANIATKAALTGHLVLSSLHTNNALQAITRLIDMGVESYIAAPALIGVMAQRLTRKLCNYCKVIDSSVDEVKLRQYIDWRDDVPLPPFYKGKGCSHCNGRGYSGRIAIHEIVRIDGALRELIMKGSHYNEIAAYAYSQGFKDMRFDGFVKALQGLTTLAEVLRVTADE